MEGTAAPLQLRFLTIPNLVTASRLGLAPLALWAHQVGTPTALFICCGLIFIAEVTDMLDGAVARWTGQVSDVGKLLDPLCDSVFRCLVFLGFLASGWMDLWMMAVILTRDIFVAYTRVFTALYNVVLQARISGKVKAWFQGIAQGFSVFFFALQGVGVELPAARIAWWLLLLATVVTAWSAVDYIVSAARTIRAQAVPPE